jgi:hypothetical protein
MNLLLPTVGAVIALCRYNSFHSGDLLIPGVMPGTPPDPFEIQYAGYAIV